MSGVEFAVAASLVSSAVSAAEQVQVANEEQNYELQQIREQSVQVRLQENQQTIARQKALERTLAAEEVSLGVRNIASTSGSVRALTFDHFGEFYADESASKLNLASKQLALMRQSKMIRQHRNTRVYGSIINAGKEAAGTYMEYKTYSDLVDIANRSNPNYKKPAPTSEGGEESFGSFKDIFRNW
jgi:ABC-type transporter MlaC component